MASRGEADAGAAMPPTIGKYTIERELGRGGMGAVYVGLHPVLGRRAAIKVLLPQVSQREDLVQRFITEAKAASAIRHPGIVEVFDYGTEPDGTAFLVMEYLEGESLAARLRSHGRLAIPQAVAFAREIALALGAAHRAGIVHRDLKPDNVFVVADPNKQGGAERIKLLDFGVAKLADDAAVGPAQTVTGAILGTPQYMSPEQCEGSRVVDHRTDLYSLGCTLFQMLSGRLPFVETGVGGLIGAHLHTPAPELREHCHAASPALASIVARLLAKSPDERFATADELAAALEHPAVSAVTRPQPLPVTPIAGGTEPGSAVLSHVSAPHRVAPAGRGLAWKLGLGVVLAALAGAVSFALLHDRDDAPATTAVRRVQRRADRSPAVEPVTPANTRKAPEPREPTMTSPAELRLALLRDAAARQDYALAGDELAKLYAASPDAAVRAEADRIKAELAPRAIAEAVPRIAKLRAAASCQAAKAEAARVAATWGADAALERASTPCRTPATVATTSPVQRAATPEPDPTPEAEPAPELDPAPAIHAAYRAKRYTVVVGHCLRQPPDRASTILPCLVSACRIDKPELAVQWMNRRRLTRAENFQQVNALNECLMAGHSLTDVAARMRRANEPPREKP